MLRIAEKVVAFLILLWPAVLCAQPVVTATSDHPDYIRVNWTAVPGAVRYVVRRSDLVYPYGQPCLTQPIVRITPDNSGELLFDQYPNSDPNGLPNPGHNAHFAVSAVYSTGQEGACSSWAVGRFSAPEITQPPVSQRVFLGNQVTFSVGAVGPHLNFRWQRAAFGQMQATDIPSAPNSPSYTLTPGLADGGYYYQVVVSNAPDSSTTSSRALLSVDGPPQISLQPRDQSVLLGDVVTFRAGANGYQVQHQWDVFRRNRWDVIPGATSSSFSFTTQDFDDGLAFRCRMSNGAGEVISNSAVVTVLTVPHIASQPANQIRYDGQGVTFSVQAIGHELNFQWSSFANGAWIEIPGATQAFYEFVPHESDSGRIFRCVVFNNAGSDISQGALLTVYGAPVFTVQPSNVLVEVGEPVDFTAHAQGMEISGLQWQYAAPGGAWQNYGAGMPSAFTETLHYDGAWLELDQTQFRMCATNLAGTRCSNAALLTVHPAGSSSSSSSSSSASSSQGSSSSSRTSQSSSSTSSSSSSDSSSAGNSSNSSQSSNQSSSNSSSASSVEYSSSSSEQSSLDDFRDQGCDSVDLSATKEGVRANLSALSRSGLRASERLAAGSSPLLRSRIRKQITALKKVGQKSAASAEQAMSGIPTDALVCPETAICRSMDISEVPLELLGVGTTLKKRVVGVPLKIAHLIGREDLAARKVLSVNRRKARKAFNALQEAAMKIPGRVSGCAR